MDDENKDVKKDIIQRFIKKQPQKPRVQREESFSNLKITIKEDILQKSCAN